MHGVRRIENDKSKKTPLLEMGATLPAAAGPKPEPGGSAAPNLVLAEYSARLTLCTRVSRKGPAPNEKRLHRECASAPQDRMPPQGVPPLGALGGPLVGPSRPPHNPRSSFFRGFFVPRHGPMPNGICFPGFRGVTPPRSQYLRSVASHREAYGHMTREQHRKRM